MTALDQVAQTILAAWVAMTVMVAEYTDAEDVAIPQEDRDFLHRLRLPPPHWRIWIGRHQLQFHPLYAHNAMTLVAEKEIEPET